MADFEGLVIKVTTVSDYVPPVIKVDGQAYKIK